MVGQGFQGDRRLGHVFPFESTGSQPQPVVVTSVDVSRGVNHQLSAASQFSQELAHLFFEIGPGGVVEHLDVASVVRDAIEPAQVVGDQFQVTPGKRQRGQRLVLVAAGTDQQCPAVRKGTSLGGDHQGMAAVGFGRDPHGVLGLEILQLCRSGVEEHARLLVDGQIHVPVGRSDRDSIRGDVDGIDGATDHWLARFGDRGRRDRLVVFDDSQHFRLDGFQRPRATLGRLGTSSRELCRVGKRPRAVAGAAGAVLKLQCQRFLSSVDPVGQADGTDGPQDLDTNCKPGTTAAGIPNMGRGDQVARLHVDQVAGVAVESHPCAGGDPQRDVVPVVSGLGRDDQSRCGDIERGGQSGV